MVGFSKTGLVKNDIRNTMDTSNNNELKILTWNIYMLPYCSVVNRNHYRAKIIADKIKHCIYDIIVFQEAFDHRSRKLIKNELDKIYPFQYGPVNESFFSVRTNSGLWILSKIPLKKKEEIEFSTRYGIDALARKGAVLFAGKWKGNKFQLLGTHLQADSPDEIRREQCNEIAERLLQKYKKELVPQIICGDFNIESEDSLNYSHMLTTLKARDGILEGEIQTTYDEIENLLAKKEDGKKRIIDYVLVSNAEIIQSIRRKVTILRDFQKNEFVELSDHYGIEASINFNPLVTSDYLLGDVQQNKEFQVSLP